MCNTERCHGCHGGVPCLILVHEIARINAWRPVVNSALQFNSSADQETIKETQLAICETLHAWIDLTLAFAISLQTGECILGTTNVHYGFQVAVQTH